MSAIVVKRYHVVAWGSAEHPDLCIETDTLPADLNWKYPFVSISRQDVVRLSDLRYRLDGSQGWQP